MVIGNDLGHQDCQERTWQTWLWQRMSLSTAGSHSHPYLTFRKIAQTSSLVGSPRILFIRLWGHLSCLCRLRKRMFWWVCICFSSQGQSQWAWRWYFHFNGCLFSQSGRSRHSGHFEGRLALSVHFLQLGYTSGRSWFPYHWVSWSRRARLFNPCRCEGFW